MMDRRWVALLLSALVATACAGGRPTTGPGFSPDATGASGSPGASVSPGPSAARSSPTPLSPSPSAPPAISPAPSSGTLEGGWREVLSVPDATLETLVAGGPGLIAGGCRQDPEQRGAGACAEAMILTSADGSTWTPAIVEAAAGAQVRSIERIRDGYAAIGSRLVGGSELRAVLWTSADGRTWAAVEPASFRERAVTDILQVTDGYIAVGSYAPYGSEYNGFLLWTSRDGRTWAGPRSIDIEGRPPLVAGVAAAPGGYVAWGADYEGPLTEIRMILMTSPDAVAWKVVPAQASLHGASIADVARFGAGLVARSGAGLVAVGSAAAADGSEVAATWTSSEGTAWARGPEPSDARMCGMTAVTTAAGGFVARGRCTSGTQERPASWRSVDGVRWSRVPDGIDRPAVDGLQASDPVALPSGRVVVGTTWGYEGQARAEIYLARSSG